ncbi:MAG: Uma2 family endonuclease [Planctomycetaceae bacterium]
MSAILESTAPEWTLGDLYERFGPIPLSRIRRLPEPGTATEDDVLDVHDREGRACELVDGILVEKTMGQYESMLAVRLSILIGMFVRANRLGEVFGEAGFMKLRPGLIRIPDVSFVSKERLKTARIRPGGKIQALVPELAIEVLIPGNTKQEMDRKLAEFFQAGVQLVWYVDPRVQRVTVYHAENQSEVIQSPAELKGDPVLPGLSISLTELFAPPEED